MSYLLAIDAGTGSGRAIMFDEAGGQVAAVQREWTHPSDPRYPGSMDFDVRHNWALLSSAVLEVVTKSGVKARDIVAVSATSMREGVVLYDEAGKELWACANVDARAAAEVRELSRNHPELEKRFYHLTGETFALGLIPRLLWVKRHAPELYHRTRRVSMLSDWILARLCGDLVSDPSNAGTTGVLALATRDWDPDIARAFDLKDDIFPPVAEVGTVIGNVTAKAATETGLAPGTPVVMGGGDAQLGCAALGVVAPGQTAVLGGTFWQQEVNLAHPITDPAMNIRVNPHAVPGMYQAEAIVFFAGMTVRWFRDAFCQQEVDEARARGLDPYTVLEQLAATVPAGSHGILPIFSDEMRFSHWTHAAPSLLNLTLDASCGKKEIFRALLENAAIVTTRNLELVKTFTGTAVDVITFAGGAAKGSLWSQIVADVAGVPVRVPVVKEATAQGAALAAGVGVGVYSSLAEAGSALVRWERDYHPDPERHAVYQEVMGRWVAAYEKQRDLMEAGVTQALWKAPGL